ncbi:hypothetical protein T05_5488, partial [Trichinella murrelli]
NINDKENKKKKDGTFYVVPACPPTETVTIYNKRFLLQIHFRTRLAYADLLHFPMLLLFPAIHGTLYGMQRTATGTGSAIRCGYFWNSFALHCSCRGGVTLRISSKIYPRSLFSLTPN